jgi:hypothetical protein
MPNPTNPLTGLQKATGIGADPNALPQAPDKLGIMPLGPWSGLYPWSGAMSGLKSLFSGGTQAAEEMAPQIGAQSIRTVPPSTPTPQVQPTGSDVDALTGLMKYNLAKVPTAASKMPMTAGQGMGTSAAGANDLIGNPDSLRMMDKMYQQANPTFRALQEQGLFSGPRMTNTIGRTPVDIAGFRNPVPPTGK